MDLIHRNMLILINSKLSNLLRVWYFFSNFALAWVVLSIFNRVFIHNYIYLVAAYDYIDIEIGGNLLRVF